MQQIQIPMVSDARWSRANMAAGYSHSGVGAPVYSIIFFNFGQVTTICFMETALIVHLL